MKLVYMGDSKSPAERRAGSSPAAGTTFNSPDQIGRGFFMSEIKSIGISFRVFGFDGDLYQSA